MSTPTPATVTLDEPVKREGGDIASIQVRRPNSGELRGLSLAELLNSNVDPLIKLLPRITLPTLTEAEVKKLAPADLVQLSGAVINFLAPKAAMEQFQSE
ncbi:MAG: phage tail assembly protein [Pseudomonadota bacterium]|nr:phage tail assembly protein [Pseudomonadota bacterium]